MVKQGYLCRIITMRLHPLGFIDNDEMLILIERLYQIGVSHRDGFIRIVLCVKGQANFIAFFNWALPINGFSVDEHVFFRT